MIDITLRMDYADVFDFDKFHEVFRQQLTVAKGDECITLAAIIPNRIFFMIFGFKGETINVVGTKTVQAESRENVFSMPRRSLTSQVQRYAFLLITARKSKNL